LLKKIQKARGVPALGLAARAAKQKPAGKVNGGGSKATAGQ
jgi:hypothetical protein